MANELGFSSGDATLIATAISELARNIVSYARKGQITIKMVNGLNRQGIAVIANDDGRGIPDIRHALRDGFSTSGSLGLGLHGAPPLLYALVITSQPGLGTHVAA